MRTGMVLLMLLAGARPAGAQHAGHDTSNVVKDSAFHALQARGHQVMGVDQYTSAHKFESLPNGGRIELQREVDDTAGVSQIRKHLMEIAEAFRRGDLRAPGLVHGTTVPGVDGMMAKRNVIRVIVRDLPRGGEMRITSDDSDAIKAIHEFLAFQRTDHRTGDAQQH